MPRTYVPTLDLVSNRQLRRTYEKLRDREDLSAREIAIRAGWFTSGGLGDADYALRLLGAKCETTKEGKRRYRRRIALENAVKLAKAMHVDPREVGF